MRQQKAYKLPRQESHKEEPKFLKNRVDNYYRERVEETWQGRHILKGLTPGKDAILINNNDYLGIASHPKITEAQVQCLLKEGNGMMMSSVFSRGETLDHKFEKALAKFIDAEDVVLSQSGWCANTGLIQAIADEETPVYIDMFAHTSLWEGIQSAGAQAKPFRHNDVDHLEKLIKKYGVGVIIVDSVYSTNGSVCPLVAMAEVSERYGCVMVVDESHSLGTHGKKGEGLVASLGLTDKVLFRTASLAKGFIGRGGIIAGPARVLEYFRYEARPAIFSSSVLPHDVAGFIAALEVIKKEDWRREKLHNNAAYLRKGLAELGFNVEISQSQIIALEAGTEQQTMALRDALESRGIFGAVFCWPATPKSRSLVRLSVSALHTREQLDTILEVCAEIRSELNFQDWSSTKRLAKRPPHAKTATAELVENANNVFSFAPKTNAAK